MKPLSIDLAGARFHCRRIEPARPSPTLAEDLARGFAARPRSIPPKYFYDAAGSALFEQICSTPEYYPSRSESALLERHALDLIEASEPRYVVEFGSGSSRKTRYLLDACERSGHRVEYWPFDVCDDMLREAGQGLIDRYPWLKVDALSGDYLGGLRKLPRPDGPTLYMFLGGTIGNFTPAESRAFLAEVTDLLRPGDRFLLGADRVKDAAVIEAAYNDAEGVTAAFNLNMLEVLNRELGADFDPAGFRHHAVYNSEAQRIEMYLIACGRQHVAVEALGMRYCFDDGEAILTEISRKFTAEGLEAMLADAGLWMRRHFEGGERLFSLVLAEPR